MPLERDQRHGPNGPKNRRKHPPKPLVRPHPAHLLAVRRGRGTLILDVKKESSPRPGVSVFTVVPMPSTRTPDPRSADAGLFLDSAPPAKRLHYLLNYAIMAPSAHNAQPWKFKVLEHHVEFHHDHTRILPVVDPHARESLISVACAIESFRIAMRRFGLSDQVEWHPDAAPNEPVAIVRMEGRHSPSAHELRLFDSIPNRRTNRMAFDPRPVGRSELELLQAVVHEAHHDGSPAQVRVEATSDAFAKHEIADLVAQADRLQFADDNFRTELAHWMRPNDTDKGDGLPAYAQGMSGRVWDILSHAGPFIMRTFDVGKGRAAKDRQLAEGSPALAIIHTADDDHAAWLATGAALTRLLLAATSMGISASYLNQPIEVESLRPRLSELIAAHLAAHTAMNALAQQDRPDAKQSPTIYPQILLRLGYADYTPATPRRPLADFIMEGSEIE